MSVLKKNSSQWEKPLLMRKIKQKINFDLGSKIKI